MRIRPRCFVVMPYGRKPVGRTDAGRSIEVDFDAVYERLLVPALRQAGCTWFRSSEETTSADIRTGMFYELATSDFVLSDISILNANVFYELGVRHGLSNRGSILVHGGWVDQPIDIAVDKSFRYSGKLFSAERHQPEVQPEIQAEIKQEIQRLAALIAGAVHSDPRHVSSPVYKELRGLLPPDTSRIDIARVGYANRWYREWTEKVSTAQRKGAASDIMTLAGDAANSLQAAQVFYTAAWALIGLQRFEFAEELLRAAVQADPMHVEAQCQLGLVLNRRGHANEAAEYLNRVKNTHHESMNWLGALGRVNKDMWRDSWKDFTDMEERLKVCLKNQGRAYAALDLYQERLNRDRASHYAAINVCAIVTWLRNAASRCGGYLDRDLENLLKESKEIVRNAGERDRKDPDDRGYWACTSLAELALCEGDLAQAVREYERAAHWPGRGKFDIQSMLSHLRIYYELGLHVETTSGLMRVLDEVSDRMFASETFNKVVVCLGHMTDEPENPGVFDQKLEPLKQAITEKLREWHLGKGDLAICRGMRGAEIIFAEACVILGMKVRLLIPLPEDEFIEKCVHAPRTEWQTRYTRLISSQRNVEVKFQDFELGAAPPTSSAMRRGVLWCLNTARVAVNNPSALHLLFVRPDSLATSPSGFRAGLDEMLRLPAIRTDIDPGTLPAI
ncbi:MAG TPA: tetratricopeptide repeat-containing protein [Xanthobacteraceae bacterium]|nr:tetratricopeptide repeat-containing protein [Xanthobacteraceae bacterium]